MAFLNLINSETSDLMKGEEEEGGGGRGGVVAEQHSKRTNRPLVLVQSGPLLSPLLSPCGPAAFH